MRKFKYIFLAAVMAIVFGATASQAKAAPVISVAFGPGFAINETNFAPGDTITRTFTVTKNSDGHHDLEIEFNLTSGTAPALENVIFVKIQKPDGTFSTLPNGTDTESLAQLDSAHNFIYDYVTGADGTSYVYTLFFTMDKNAGNEYQSTKVVFDISSGVKVTARAAGGGGGGGPTVVTTAGPTGIIAGAGAGGPTGGGVVGPGEVQGAENQPQVEGAQTACAEWPLWIWILILAIFTVVFNYIDFKRFKEQKKVRWFWQLALTTAVFLVWFYFDKCHLYGWFPYVMIILAILSFWYYLHKFRQLVSGGQGPAKAE